MIARRVLKSKKAVTEVQVVRRVLISKLPVPPIPGPHQSLTPAMEAFESIREFCALNNIPIKQSDIKWYLEELKREKQEMDAFWTKCAVTKATIDSIYRGDDEWTMALAINEAKQKAKDVPLTDTDLGPMPAFKTPEFWAWCHKRKKLRLQKEAEIIAKGGSVPKKKGK